MPVLQSSVDYIHAQFIARLGDPYVFGGCYIQGDPSEGSDCSYVGGWALEGYTKGLGAMSWTHNVSTESWYYDYSTNTPASPGSVGPYGTVAIARPEDLSPDAALLICIMHGGGGADSHMNVITPDGTIMESNGDAGSCTNGTGGTPASSNIWTDFWELPGPIVNDENVTPLFYPDVSNVQWGLPHTDQGQEALISFLEAAKAAGMAGVMHKVSEGPMFSDPYWRACRGWCESNDMSWLGYHYVDLSDPSAQAANFVNNDGGSWAMLDFEQNSGSISQFWNVVNAFNNHGVSVSMAYIPQWYWGQIGQPDLSYLTANQISLVSSNYPGGSGIPQHIYQGPTGPGWVPYGNCRPAVWQFTDQALIGGLQVDCNAYVGPGPNLDALFTGSIF